MRFLMRFRVQNVPDPTLHESLFHEASCGLERKVSHIIWRQPSFEFLPTWRYFVAALRDYKTVRGRLGQVLCAKSHQNRTKIASKIACVNGPLWKRLAVYFGNDSWGLAHAWSSSNFPCSFTRNITSHTMKNLAFHSLLRKDDYPTNSHYLTYTFCLRGWENVTFWPWEWKG